MAGELKNRTKLGDAVDNKLYNKLNQIKNNTKIPRSRLLDEALELLIEKRKDDLDKE